MNLYVLDTDFVTVKVLDTYESFIWTDRYYEYGDFEIYTPMTEDILTYIKQDYYLVSTESEHAMIIEKILIESDVEDGNYVTISGRSLESILDRRIVWGLKTLNGNLSNVIYTLLKENIISPSDSDRKISGFSYNTSVDSAITSISIDTQYTGDNLYDVISGLCKENGVGFKITLDSNGYFVFSLYVGKDRSYDQTENPYVIFSPNFENIINSNYMESKQALKNVSLIGGEGEGTERRYASTGSGTGMDRREMFTDARDISSTTEDSEELTDAEYTALLQQRGNEDLAENIAVVSFEGEVEATQIFVYGEDFGMGDIVQVADEYGHEVKARVLEFVRSEDNEGISTYPTFNTIEEE